MLISTCNGNCRFHRPASAGRSFSIFSQEGLGPPCNDFGDYVGVATVIGGDGRVSVHPCRIRKGFQPTCFVPYNGAAIQHRGQYVAYHSSRVSMMVGSLTFFRRAPGLAFFVLRMIWNGYQLATESFLPDACLWKVDSRRQVKACTML